MECNACRALTLDRGSLPLLPVTVHRLDWWRYNTEQLLLLFRRLSHLSTLCIHPITLDTSSLYQLWKTQSALCQLESLRCLGVDAQGGVTLNDISVAMHNKLDVLDLEYVFKTPENSPIFKVSPLTPTTCSCVRL